VAIADIRLVLIQPLGNSPFVPGLRILTWPRSEARQRVGPGHTPATHGISGNSCKYWSYSVSTMVAMVSTVAAIMATLISIVVPIITMILVSPIAIIMASVRLNNAAT
jgi:hypothetical protein